MIKLRLKASQKSAVEIAVGEYRVNFVPGQTVEIDDPVFAEYLLGRPEIARATDADTIIEIELPEPLPPLPSDEKPRKGK